MRNKVGETYERVVPGVVMLLLLVLVGLVAWLMGGRIDYVSMTVDIKTYVVCLMSLILLLVLVLLGSI